MCSIPLYIPPASLASRGRDPHLNTQNDNYANGRMYGRIYSMYYFLCIIIVLSGFLLHMQASIRTQLLTSIFSEQQQMALQHWSSVSFMMEELWGKKSHGKTKRVVSNNLPDEAENLLLFIQGYEQNWWKGMTVEEKVEKSGYTDFN